MDKQTYEQLDRIEEMIINMNIGIEDIMEKLGILEPEKEEDKEETKTEKDEDGRRKTRLKEFRE